MTDVAVRDAPTVHHRRTHVLAGMAARHRSLVAAVSIIVGSWAAMLTAMPRQWVSNDARMLYLPTARNLLEHGRYSVMDQSPYLPTITKMPGYSFFLAAEQSLFGDGLGPLRAVQFVLVGLTALLAADAARRLFDRRTATVTAVLVAAYPALAVYAMYPLSETLTCLLAVAFVDALIAALADGRATGERAGAPAGRSAVVAVGASLGALVLVRQSFAFLAPVAVLAVFTAGRRSSASWRAGVRRATVVAVVTGALVAPWCVRNMVVSGRLLPFGANSGLSLLVSVRQYAGDPLQRPLYLSTITEELAVIDAAGAAPSGSAPGIHEGVGGGPGREAQLDARLTELARSEAAAVPPSRFVTTLPDRLTVLWSGASFIQLFDRIELILTVLSAAAGLVIVARRPAVWPLWLLPVTVSAFHLLFHVEARYSLPARPALLVFGAAGLVHAGRVLRSRTVLHPAVAVKTATAGTGARGGGEGRP